MTLRASVVIPVWNGRRWLPGLVESLRAQTCAPHEVIAVDPAWLRGYEIRDIDVRPETNDEPTRWDAEVLDWILKYGPRRFARINLWEVDWLDVATRLDRPVEPAWPTISLICRIGW